MRQLNSRVARLGAHFATANAADRRRTSSMAAIHCFVVLAPGPISSPEYFASPTIGIWRECGGDPLDDGLRLRPCRLEALRDIKRDPEALRDLQREARRLLDQDEDGGEAADVALRVHRHRTDVVGVCQDEADARTE